MPTASVFADSGKLCTLSGCSRPLSATNDRPPTDLSYTEMDASFLSCSPTTTASTAVSSGGLDETWYDVTQGSTHDRRLRNDRLPLFDLACVRPGPNKHVGSYRAKADVTR
ncbi:hypothetical protein BIW11_11022 [Tropilaelaps mercedesae]|uniref:Uncharacterized protein n=1 Tax=Tropilaelaps mercedesae TaxID=418985 RepID=A0A1V9XDC5_9ACAR|nr:hypothetical protein BIW11_11022 [Tropilaelaps mercedesae]